MPEQQLDVFNRASLSRWKESAADEWARLQGCIATVEAADDEHDCLAQVEGMGPEA